MLPKKERLSRAAFSRFFAAGTRHNSPLVQMIYTPHETLHVSVVISKKVSAKAVVRNKIRRQIYDIVRRHRDMHVLTGVFIFVARPAITDVPYERMREHITTLCKSL